MIVVDTNICIDFFKQEPYAVSFFTKQRDVVMSYVVIGELLQGVRNKQELHQLQDFIQMFNHDYGSHTVSRRALGIVQDSNLSHGIKLFDALLAATALEKEAVLMTRNAKHFRHITELQLDVITA
jgi:hypothetical protein